MNAKHLFLTLTAIVVCSVAAKAAGVTDVISYSAVSTNYGSSLAGEDYNANVTGLSFNSAAQYAAASFWYDPVDENFGIEQNTAFATTASAASNATVKSVAINWVAGDLNLNSDDSPVIVHLYARNNKPYTGNENVGSAGLGTEVCTFTFGGTSAYSFTEDYKYIALIAECEFGAFFTGITIAWEWEEITTYSVAAGSITGEGAISISPTTAAAGETITVTFEPHQTGKKPKIVTYSLTSYSFDDMIFDLSCADYITYPNTYTITFPMPARDVTIDATFERITQTTTKINIEAEKTVQSGVEDVISFTHTTTVDPYPLVTGYTGIVTVTSDNESVAYVDNIVKVSDGNYTFTVHGLAAGDALISITAPSAGRIAKSEGEITIHVEPRQAALVAEADGRYFVAKNTLVGGKFETIEVFKNGDKYLYSGSFAPSEVTWYISTLNSDGSEYSVQNADEQFLAPTGLSFKFQDDKFTWYDDDGRYQDAVSYNYIAYNTGSAKFTMGNYATAAKDALLSAFYPMTYSTSSTADVGVVDGRTITNTYGTICVPFDVASVAGSGAQFYTIESKTVSGATLLGFTLSEPHTALVAGHSYIYEMEEGIKEINFTGSNTFLYNAVDIADDGLVGCLAKDKDPDSSTEGVLTVPYNSPKSDGCFILYKNKMRYVNITNQTIKALRAYIDASEVTDGAPAPGRKMIVCEGAEGVPTAIVNVPDAMCINWDEPVYNIMGMRVGKGATGVLIQNGQKFFVQ